MKKSVWTCIGLVALIAALFGALGALRESDDAAPQVAPRIYLINDRKPNLASITVERAGEAPYTILNNVYFDAEDDAIESDEPVYLLEEDPDFAVDVALALNMVNHALSFRVQSEVLGRAEDLAEFGLEDARLRLCVRFRDGTQKTLLFGDTVPTKAYVYVKDASADPVYIVFTSVLDVFDVPLSALAAGGAREDAHN